MQSSGKFGTNNEIYGSKTFFRELGYYILRLEHYQRSLKAFDEAIKYTPDDIRALLGRAKSRAKASQYEGTLDDIQRALKIDPDNLQVLASKALATYWNCEFEGGLVHNSRLLLRRRKPDNFALGVMHCTNAIETCIGEHAGNPLRDHFKIIHKIAWEKNKELLEGSREQKKKKQIRPFYVCDDFDNDMPVANRKKTGINKKESQALPHHIRDSLRSVKSQKNVNPPLEREIPFRPLQNYTTNIENFMSEKYLGSMYLDKNFLKIIQNEAGVSSPNEKGSQTIKQLAKTGYQMVAHKQELLRTRRPFYHIKYKEGTSTITLKKKQEQQLFVQQQTTRSEATLLYIRLQKLLKEKKIREMLDCAEKLKRYCDAKSKRLLPDKDKYLENIFKIIRQGYYQLYRLNPNQYPWDQEKRIHISLGLPVSRVPSNDSVIDDIKPVFSDYKKNLSILEKRLQEQAQSSEEICWCYGEMCKNSIEMKKFDLARAYAKYCIREAKKSNNLEWIFITTMLLVKINVQQRNRNDALNELDNASKVAKELGNQGLEKYVQKCLQVVRELNLNIEFGSEIILNRQKNILAIIENTNLKKEFSHLFKMMSGVTASRRLTVIPGYVATSTSDAHKFARRSITPGNRGKGDVLGEDAVQLKLDKKVTSSLKTKGVDFLNLVECHIDNIEN